LRLDDRDCLAHDPFVVVRIACRAHGAIARPSIAILDRADWAAWLDPSISAKTILKPLSAGSLGVERVG
jgi:hypothetical protein